jgi:hypothetical protein
MPPEMGAFFMLTYTATNTKTGQFYVGSALNYCRYMARKGTHHVMTPGRGYTLFQRDLQADPTAFVWDYFEDDRKDRNAEKTLLDLYKGSKFLYNVGEGVYSDRRTGWHHTEASKAKIRNKMLAHSDTKRDLLKQIVNSKEPCPHCGKLMNPGNLKQHLRAMTCQK